MAKIRIDTRLAEQMARPPVITHAAEAPGPVIAITANVHGDEITGTIAVQALDRMLPTVLARGVVHLYPSLNPPGLVARSRGVGADGADLNRAFPGESTGGTVDRLAHAIWRDLDERDPAVLIDLHADASAAIPYAIVDRPVALKGRDREGLERKLDEHAEASGLTVLRDYPADQYQRYGLDRSLAGCFVNKKRRIAVTVEAGPRRAIDPMAVETTVRAVRGVMFLLKMITDCPEPHSTRISGRFCRNTSVRARIDGLFVPSLPPGAKFRAGEKLGDVRSIAGETVEEVRATFTGFVVSWPDAGWVAAGVPIGTFGADDP